MRFIHYGYQHLATRWHVSLRRSLPLLTVAALFAAAPTAQARMPMVRDGNTSGTINITIKGVLLEAPPCVINNNQPIDVNFGDDLGVNSIDGSQYLTRINYSVTCTGGASNNMKLSIQGNATDFDDAALQTNMSDLGIELLHDGNKVKVGDDIAFTYPDLPVLDAVPVRRANATLSAGDFSAGATMVVNLQ